MNKQILIENITALREQAVIERYNAEEVRDNTDCRDIKSLLAGHQAIAAKARISAYDEVLNMLAGNNEVEQ